VKVKAHKAIVSVGGICVAKAGDTGIVEENRTPTRSSHYGLVPVVWGTRKRAYWVDPSAVSVTDGGDIDKYVTPPPTSEGTLDVPSADEMPYDFGGNLSVIRKSRGFSQEGLARKMEAYGADKVSQATLSKWESRSDSPSGVFISAAARALEVPAFVLFLDFNNLEACGSFIHKFLERSMNGNRPD